MKPIDQMALTEVLGHLRFSNFYDELSVENTCNMQADVADHIHDLTRWIPVSERMPTEEDADQYGLVLKWDSITGSVQVDSWNYFGTHNVCFTHWKRITPPEGV